MFIKIPKESRLGNTLATISIQHIHTVVYDANSLRTVNKVNKKNLSSNSLKLIIAPLQVSLDKKCFFLLLQFNLTKRRICDSKIHNFVQEKKKILFVGNHLNEPIGWNLKFLTTIYFFFHGRKVWKQKLWVKKNGKWKKSKVS